MRIGALTRTEVRGLGIQSRDFARHMNADPLIVDMTDPPAGSDGRRVRCQGNWTLDRRTVRAWLREVDVVWSAETFYDPNLTEWARAAGVPTVLHANPEFVPPKPSGWGIGHPTAWWSATCWRRTHMPKATQVVPFPVELAPPVAAHDGPTRFCHVAGKATVADRNGTAALIEAIQYLREPCSVTIVTQESALPAKPNAPRHVDVRVVTGGLPDRADLYDADVLVMPRCFGGLCLPVQEAMAHGLAVVMPDIDPNPQTWPVVTFPASGFHPVGMPAGMVDVANVDPIDIARTMDGLADPDLRSKHQEAARAWAEEHSWEKLAPVYRAMLERL